MIDFSGLYEEFNVIPERVEKAILAYGETEAARMEKLAKENRRWRDRSGEARKRLTGSCETIPEGIRITLSHGVDYGVSLEFRYEKKYAIIYPTLRKEAPEVMQGLKGLMERL